MVSFFLGHPVVLSRFSLKLCIIKIGDFLYLHNRQIIFQDIAAHVLYSFSEESKHVLYVSIFQT